jgi:hypothetical protein
MWDFSWDYSHTAEHLTSGLAAGLSSWASSAIQGSRSNDQDRNKESSFIWRFGKQGNEMKQDFFSGTEHMGMVTSGAIHSALMTGMYHATGGAGFKNNYYDYDWNSLVFTHQDMGNTLGGMLADGLGVKQWGKSTHKNLFDGNFTSRFGNLISNGYFECAQDVGMTDERYNEWSNYRAKKEDQGNEVSINNRKDVENFYSDLWMEKLTNGTLPQDIGINFVKNKGVLISIVDRSSNGLQYSVHKFQGDQSNALRFDVDFGDYENYDPGNKNSAVHYTNAVFSTINKVIAYSGMSAVGEKFTYTVNSARSHFGRSDKKYVDQTHLNYTVAGIAMNLGREFKGKVTYDFPQRLRDEIAWGMPVDTSDCIGLVATLGHIIGVDTTIPTRKNINGKIVTFNVPEPVNFLTERSKDNPYGYDFNNKIINFSKVLVYSNVKSGDGTVWNHGANRDKIKYLQATAQMYREKKNWSEAQVNEYLRKEFNKMAYTVVPKSDMTIRGCGNLTANSSVVDIFKANDNLNVLSHLFKDPGSIIHDTPNDLTGMIAIMYGNYRDRTTGKITGQTFIHTMVSVDEKASRSVESTGTYYDYESNKKLNGIRFNSTIRSHRNLTAYWLQYRLPKFRYRK